MDCKKFRHGMMCSMGHSDADRRLSAAEPHLTALAEALGERSFYVVHLRVLLTDAPENYRDSVRRLVAEAVEKVEERAQAQETDSQPQPRRKAERRQPRREAERPERTERKRQPRREADRPGSPQLQDLFAITKRSRESDAPKRVAAVGSGDLIARMDGFIAGCRAASDNITAGKGEWSELEALSMELDMIITLVEKAEAELGDYTPAHCTSRRKGNPNGGSESSGTDRRSTRRERKQGDLHRRGEGRGRQPKRQLSARQREQRKTEETWG